MATKPSLEMQWIKVGIVAGLMTTIAYPLLLFVPLPAPLTLILACFVGPFLSTASVGLYHFLKINGKRVTLQIAVVANIIAGTVFNLMLIVQLARRMSMRDYLSGLDDAATREMLTWISKGVLSVQAGLDVSWDIYIVIGTFCFGLAMLRHPRFGKIFGGSGILLALLVLGFNLYTFPFPPAESGLIDFGPFVGLWYLAVTIQILRSLKWAEEAVAAGTT